MQQITEKFNDQHQDREQELIKSLNEMVKDKRLYLTPITWTEIPYPHKLRW